MTVECVVPTFIMRDALVGWLGLNAHGDRLANHQSVHGACRGWDIRLDALFAVVDAKDMSIARLPLQTLRVDHEDVDLNAVGRTEGHRETVYVKSILRSGVRRCLTYCIAVRYWGHTSSLQYW